MGELRIDQPGLVAADVDDDLDFRQECQCFADGFLRITGVADELGGPHGIAVAQECDQAREPGTFESMQKLLRTGNGHGKYSFG
ncbi:MAG: hypothetical protein CVU46_11600 [Chloroflexi bacterium HGW-Chloroflexi-8]|nr:MAG: hypothetical protein CVU46_11600 [Chloroflexi bacterium HGW-Chloroflexi-8]